MTIEELDAEVGRWVKRFSERQDTIFNYYSAQLEGFRFAIKVAAAIMLVLFVITWGLVIWTR